MKDYLLIAITIFLLSGGNALCQKSVGSQKTIKQTKSEIDTVCVPVPADSMTFSVKTIEKLPKKSFFDEYFGTFLGSFLAAIVALISIWVANRVNTRNEKKKNQAIKDTEKLHYSSLLGISVTILSSHRTISTILYKEVEAYKSLSLEKGKLFGNSPFAKFATGLLTEYLLQIIRYKDYDFSIATKITHYINVTEILHKELDLTDIKQWEFEDKDEFDEKIEAYFNEILKRINRIDTFRKSLIEDINKKIDQNSKASQTIDEPENLKT